MPPQPTAAPLLDELATFDIESDPFPVQHTSDIQGYHSRIDSFLDVETEGLRMNDLQAADTTGRYEKASPRADSSKASFGYAATHGGYNSDAKKSAWEGLDNDTGLIDTNRDSSEAHTLDLEEAKFPNDGDSTSNLFYANASQYEVHEETESLAEQHHVDIWTSPTIEKGGTSMGSESSDVHWARSVVSAASAGRHSHSRNRDLGTSSASFQASKIPHPQSRGSTDRVISPSRASINDLSCKAKQRDTEAALILAAKRSRQRILKERKRREKSNGRREEARKKEKLAMLERRAAQARKASLATSSSRARTSTAAVAAKTKRQRKSSNRIGALSREHDPQEAERARKKTLQRLRAKRRQLKEDAKRREREEMHKKNEKWRKRDAKLQNFKSRMKAKKRGSTRQREVEEVRPTLSARIEEVPDVQPRPRAEEPRPKSILKPSKYGSSAKPSSQSKLKPLAATENGKGPTKRLQPLSTTIMVIISIVVIIRITMRQGEQR